MHILAFAHASSRIGALAALVLVAILPAAAIAQTYQYDGLGRLTQVIETLQTTTYTYDANGNITSITIVLAATGVEPSPETPLVFSIGTIAPNPVQTSGTLRFTIPRQGHVTLRVFDVTGREIAKPVDQVLEPGVRIVTFQPSRIASGVYFFRLESQGKVLTRRFLIVR